MIVVLGITWLLLQIIPKTGLSEPAQAIVCQLVAIIGIVVGVLICFGVHMPACLTAF